MAEEDPLVEEFFSEVNDKYYPQVMEALEMLDSGDINDGIEILSRPLHTIKGVTGFMGGFEPASEYTHKVEDFMKMVQAGDVEADSANIILLSRSVNMIFQVVETLRDTGAMDIPEAEELLAAIAEASSSGGGDEEVQAEGVDSNEECGVVILKVKDKRVHLGPQRAAIVEAVITAGPDNTLLLDLSDVLTVGSRAWEEIAMLANTFDLTIVGMSPDASGVFHMWGFNKILPHHTDKETYFKANEAK